MRIIHGCEVHGVEVDAQTRCRHWHSPVDIIAIKFKCCGRWYPCFDCHAAVADHASEVWPVNKASERAVLCGVCGHQLKIEEYLACGSTCTNCSSRFNPGCGKHYHLYFELPDAAL